MSRGASASSSTGRSATCSSPDVLLEIDAQCNYSEALLGHRAETGAELLALYAALLAHGTDIDANRVAVAVDRFFISTQRTVRRYRDRTHKAGEHTLNEGHEVVYEGDSIVYVGPRFEGEVDPAASTFYSLAF